MDFELNHIGQTFAVGGFALAGMLLMMRVCRAEWVPQFLRPEMPKTLPSSAVWVALIFAAGVVLEDTSKRCVERIYENYSRTDPIAWLASLVLKSESDIRTDVLFKIESASEDEMVLRPRGLFVDLAKVPEPHAGVAPYFKDLFSLVPRDTPLKAAVTISSKENVEKLRRAVDGIHYDAKNKVYREDNYFQELSDFASRMNFTRALGFLGILFAMSYFLFGLTAWVSFISSRFMISPADRNCMLFLAVLTMVGTAFVSTSYRSQGAHFNRRVFGYYISLAFSEEKAAPAAAPVPTTPPAPAAPAVSHTSPQPHAPMKL